MTEGRQTHRYPTDMPFISKPLEPGLNLDPPGNKGGWNGAVPVPDVSLKKAWQLPPLHFGEPCATT